MPLNPSQKTSLEVVMRQLETALLRVRQFVQNPPENSLLTHYRPVSEGTRPGLEMMIDQMLAEIAILVHEYDLQPREEDLGRYIDAEMGVAWADLYDTLSPKLRRFGDVDPALETTLDPHIRRLIKLAHTLGLSARVGDSPRSTTS